MWYLCWIIFNKVIKPVSDKKYAVLIKTHTTCTQIKNIFFFLFFYRKPNFKCLLKFKKSYFIWNENILSKNKTTTYFNQVLLFLKTRCGKQYLFIFFLSLSTLLPVSFSAFLFLYLNNFMPLSLSLSLSLCLSLCLYLNHSLSLSSTFYFTLIILSV